MCVVKTAEKNLEMQFSNPQTRILTWKSNRKNSLSNTELNCEETQENNLWQF